MEKGGFSHKLRINRVSLENRSYFVTFNASSRLCRFDSASFFKCAEFSILQMAKSGWGDIRALVVMPDHLHALVRLGHRGSMGRAIAYFKQKIRSQAFISFHWQKGFFEHLIRTEEPVLPYFRYIYENPQRAGIVKSASDWPYFYCGPTDWQWFQTCLVDPVEFPKWMAGMC